VADESNSNWKVYRPEWYNDRILETYISSPIIDKQNDKVSTGSVKEAMDFYMKYGVYSYKHEEMPVGLPLAYQIKDGKVKLRVGVHNRLPMHNRVWEEMQIYGDKGGSSIRGEAEKQEKVCEGEVCHNEISALSLWSVSWVGNKPANPEATVTNVATAKQTTLDDIQKIVDNAVEKKLGKRGNKWCILHHRTPGKIGQPIKGACHATRAGAERQHRAMNARRFGKAKMELEKILKRIRYLKVKKDFDDVAQTMMIMKAPKRKPQQYGRGRTKPGKKPRMRTPTKTEWNNCKLNARRLKTYYGNDFTADPERVCGSLWWDQGRWGHKPSGSDKSPNPPKRHGPRAGGKEPGNVKDPSGWKFRQAMFSANYNPKTLNRQNIARIMGGGKKGKK